MAVIVLSAGQARGEEVAYNAATGALDLIQDSTWATKTQALGLWNFEIYFAGTNANNVAPYLTANFNQGAYFAPAGTLQVINAVGTLEADPVNGINGNGWSGSSYSGIGIGNNMTFVGPSSNNHYTLPAGTYLLATLPTGLTAADFGNSRDPLGSTANDALGSVVYANGMGNETLDKVQIVNNEDDWSGPSGGTGALWNTASNWSSGVAPGLGTTATFGNSQGSIGVGAGGTVSISGTQNVGSLWFTSTNAYTLQLTPGTTGLLSLSSTAQITIDAGRQTISVPLALSGSLTVDADPAAGVAASSVGATLSGRLSGSGPLTKTGPGTLILEGSDSYTGGTIVSGGTLSTTNGGIPEGTSLIVGAGGPFTFDPTVTGSPMEGRDVAGSASTVAPLPEPGTLASLATAAICCLAAGAWRRRKRCTLSARRVATAEK